MIGKWVICREEKKCKNCNGVIKVNDNCWMYGAYEFPLFWCQSCRDKYELLHLAPKDRREAVTKESKKKKERLKKILERDARKIEKTC